MIDDKLKGEDKETEEPDRGNVVDLMAVLKKGLGQAGDYQPNRAALPRARMELPAKAPKPPAVSSLRPTRKRA